MRWKKWVGLGAGTLCVALSLIAVGCTQPAPDISTESNEAPESSYYQPAVKTLDDGTVIQRTPTEYQEITLDTSYVYFNQSKDVAPFNTYYLKADERGCNACHDDLAQTLKDMDYDHTDLSNSFYNIQITVQMCKDCHTFGYGYLTNQNSFGSLMHGIHNTDDIAQCWNCHVATGDENDDEDMQLWDEAKFTQLRGILAVPDVAGDFSYDQDLITPTEDLFDFNWLYYDNDYMRNEKETSGAELDQSTFDNWTITVSGDVKNELTYSLPDLIAKYGTTTAPVTMQCTLNATGGPFIGNANYTGVKLSDVLKDAVLGDDAGGILVTGSDGFAEAISLDNFTEAYFATQVNGETLPWRLGYPVTMMVPNTAAPASVKEVSDIVILTKDEMAGYHEWNGWPKQTDGTAYYTAGNWPFTDYNGYQNKPNVGLFDFQNGEVIQTGVPYTFNGYAHGFNKQIVAIDISMDGGVTWTRYDTPDTSRDNWTIWHFTYTPEQDFAYVLMVRAVDEDGMVTADPIEVMFNSNSTTYTTKVSQFGPTENSKSSTGVTVAGSASSSSASSSASTSSSASVSGSASTSAGEVGSASASTSTSASGSAESASVASASGSASASSSASGSATTKSTKGE